MNILTKKNKVKANISHVFHCFTDIDYIHKEFNRLAKSEGLKIIKKNQELEFKGKKTLFKLKEIEAEKPNYYKAELTPTSKQLMRFGGAEITCNFSNNGEYTKVITKITSNNNPTYFWKIFIKIIVFVLVFQSRKHEKQYVLAIEKSA